MTKDLTTGKISISSMYGRLAADAEHINDIQSEVKDLIQELPESTALISFKTIFLYFFVRRACLLIPLSNKTLSGNLLLLGAALWAGSQISGLRKSGTVSKSVVVYSYLYDA